MCCMNRGRSCYGSCNCGYGARNGLIPYSGNSCGRCSAPVQIGYNMYVRCGCWYYPICSGCSCINAASPASCQCGCPSGGNSANGCGCNNAGMSMENCGCGSAPMSMGNLGCGCNSGCHRCGCSRW